MKALLLSIMFIVAIADKECSYQQDKNIVIAGKCIKVAGGMKVCIGEEYMSPFSCEELKVNDGCSIEYKETITVEGMCINFGRMPACRSKVGNVISVSDDCL